MAFVKRGDLSGCQVSNCSGFYRLKSVFFLASFSNWWSFRACYRTVESCASRQGTLPNDGTAMS